MEDQHCLSVQSLSLRTADGFAVQEINFCLKPGEIVALLGSNGAGKSTLLNLIAGVLIPTSGSVLINGQNVHNTPSARSSLGYLPDRPPLYEELTISEQLQFSAELFGVDKKQIPTEIERVTQACELKEQSRKLLARLSKGFRQRVGLAQALIHKPDFLLLDEPTEGLDPAQILHLRELLKEQAANGTGVLMSTHLLQEARALADRVVILHKSKLVKELLAEEFQSDSALETAFTEVLFEGEPA